MVRSFVRRFSPRQVHDAGESRGSLSVSVLVVPHARQPQHPHACETAGHQMRLADGFDMGPHGIPTVASCRARPAMVAPSSAQLLIAQWIARTPNAPGVCTPALVMFQECHSSGRWFRGISIGRLCHRILVGIPAQGASPPLQPVICAITPQPGQLASWLRDSTSSTRPCGCEPRSSDGILQTDEQITPITTDQATHSSSR